MLGHFGETEIRMDPIIPLTSMSLSRFLNCSMAERALMPPQQWLERNSTGLLTLGTAGNRSRKSSSAGSICLLISSTCQRVRAVKANTGGDSGTRTDHISRSHHSRLYPTPGVGLTTIPLKLSPLFSSMALLFKNKTKQIALKKSFTDL